MDNLSSLNGGSESPIAEDPFGFPDLLNFDGYAELCSSSNSDQVFSPLGFSQTQASPGTWPSFAPPYRSGEKQAAERSNARFGFFSNSSDADNAGTSSGTSGSFGNPSDLRTPVIPRHLGSSFTLSDRMLKALSFFKESSSGGILAQVWMPVKQRDDFVLSTSEQPYLLDQILAGYREISRTFTFSAKEGPGSFPGLPGRVFISKAPEWTSNVSYYSKNEYLRVNYALAHEVRGSIALPVFDSTADGACCAVLELVTTKEKSNFDPEMDTVCKALQAVNLRTVTSQEHSQNITKGQRAAFTEIVDVLKAVCHAHMLPLALTWTPCCYANGKNVHMDNPEETIKSTSLHVQESACYVNDTRMLPFVHVCSEGHLRKGQGVAGKAFESNFPFFSADIKEYNIHEYPFVHHARRFGLNAAVAIRLRSAYTGNDDYILEFFLPFNCRGSVEQQLLLDNLSATMQKVCKSLRTVSNAEVMASGSGGVDFQQGWSGYPLTGIPSQQYQSVKSMNLHEGSDEREIRLDQMMEGQRVLTLEKKRSTAEKNISLSTLQQYFSGSLKDAAKSIGVCPTTLKRICRQHGISRWPSRKINKVNRSLKKIQTVIDSVQGVEGSLKYDPLTGSFVAAVTSAQPLTPAIDSTVDSQPPHTWACSKWAEDGGDERAADQNHLSSSGMTDSSNGSQSSSQTFKKGVKVDGDCEGAITVKATYKEDTVRLKCSPEAGWVKMAEEIGRRFKLAAGSFQLKYMDDEEEWVLLANDDDLRESVEILEFLGTRCLKVLVRDAPFSVGSSGGSNFLPSEP